MRCCHIYGSKCGKRVFSFDAEPVCAVDYCNRCGDCLVCDIEDDCNGEDGRGHVWVVFSEEADAFLKTHELPEEIANRIREIVKETV